MHEIIEPSSLKNLLSEDNVDKQEFDFEPYAKFLDKYGQIFSYEHLSGVQK